MTVVYFILMNRRPRPAQRLTFQPSSEGSKKVFVFFNSPAMADLGKGDVLQGSSRRVIILLRLCAKEIFHRSLRSMLPENGARRVRINYLRTLFRARERNKIQAFRLHLPCCVRRGAIIIYHYIQHVVRNFIRLSDIRQSHQTCRASPF